MNQLSRSFLFIDEVAELSHIQIPTTSKESVRIPDFSGCQIHQILSAFTTRFYPSWSQDFGH